MSWLLPSALAIGGVAAMAAIALHFIARSRPFAEPLPTARFIPERPIHARISSLVLTDVPFALGSESPRSSCWRPPLPVRCS